MNSVERNETHENYVKVWKGCLIATDSNASVCPVGQFSVIQESHTACYWLLKHIACTSDWSDSWTINIFPHDICIINGHRRCY